MQTTYHDIDLMVNICLEMKGGFNIEMCEELFPEHAEYKEYILHERCLMMLIEHQETIKKCWNGTTKH